MRNNKKPVITDSKYYVYVIRTSQNTLYTGQTNNLKRRIRQHKTGKGGAMYLRMFPSFELIYTEMYKTRIEAMKREIEIKKMTKVKKEQLVIKGTP